MRRRRPLAAEVEDGRDQRRAEVPRPDVVDRDPGRQRIARSVIHSASADRRPVLVVGNGFRRDPRSRVRFESSSCAPRAACTTSLGLIDRLAAALQGIAAAASFFSASAFLSRGLLGRRSSARAARCSAFAASAIRSAADRLGAPGLADVAAGVAAHRVRPARRSHGRGRLRGDRESGDSATSRSSSRPRPGRRRRPSATRVFAGRVSLAVAARVRRGRRLLRGLDARSASAIESVRRLSTTQDQAAAPVDRPRRGGHRLDLQRAERQDAGERRLDDSALVGILLVAADVAGRSARPGCSRTPAGCRPSRGPVSPGTTSSRTWYGSKNARIR